MKISNNRWTQALFDFTGDDKYPRWMRNFVARAWYWCWLARNFYRVSWTERAIVQQSFWFATATDEDIEKALEDAEYHLYADDDTH